LRLGVPGCPSNANRDALAPEASANKRSKLRGQKMEHSGVRSETQSFAPQGGQFKDNPRSGAAGSASSISESVVRGKDAIGIAANEAMTSAGSDLLSLRADINNLKDTVAKFVS
jgi:hypothetical protein